MIIGISGKKQHGKNTVAAIIQYLTMRDSQIVSGNLGQAEKIDEDYGFAVFRRLEEGLRSKASGWETKMWAEKLKEIVCLIIGCTMEQLEDATFKETSLGEEWRRWYLTRGKVQNFSKGLNSFNWDNRNKYFGSWDEAQITLNGLLVSLQEHSPEWWEIQSKVLTPRKLLQLIGTECGRGIVHPNIWVNALMSDYKPVIGLVQLGDVKTEWNEAGGHMTTTIPLPKWLVADTRFPNEVSAIVDRQGIVVRVHHDHDPIPDEHESETALDEFPFQYIIHNNGTIKDLIQSTKEFLQQIKLIS